MVQSSSREEKGIWDDLRYGFILGSQKFVNRIKSKYLSENPYVEIPQKRQVLRVTNPDALLRKAAKILKYDTKDLLQTPPYI